MNDANAPLNNLDFPNVMSPDAVQRQVSYSQQSDIPSAIDDANVDALVNLVQELNQQNHELLNRITVLEGELTAHKASIQQKDNPSGVQPFVPSAEEQSTRSSDSSDTFSAEHVSHLLNQLEFAQQANQRQDIRVESLSTQLTSYKSQVEQLEAENSDLQQRCGDQLYRLNYLEDECRDLRLRLHRQQRYTLQFKAALEKCLEVPPPSYGFVNARNYAHDMVESFQPSPDVESEYLAGTGTDDAGEEESNWLVQPLFPKVRSIKPWGNAKPQAAEPSSFPEAASDGETWSNAPETLEPSSPGSFTSGRFQSTLFTLANEAQLVDESIASISDSSLEPSAQEPELSSEAMAVECDHQDEFEDSPEQPLASAQTPLAEDTQSVDAPSVVQQEAPETSKEAIAPFSSTSLPDSEVNPQTASKPSDEKLWQSLVNLIDMSAADGLNIGSSDSKKSNNNPSPELSKEGALNQSQSEPTPPPAWSDEQSQIDESLASPPSSAVNSSPAQQEKAPVSLSTEEGEAKKPISRAIELPSFLNPGKGINPNPA